MLRTNVEYYIIHTRAIRHQIFCYLKKNNQNSIVCTTLKLRLGRGLGSLKEHWPTQSLVNENTNDTNAPIFRKKVEFGYDFNFNKNDKLKS